MLGLGLHSLGPYNNERMTASAQAAADPQFIEALALLLELQRAGRLPIEFTVRSQDRIASVRIGLGDTDQSPERRLRRLLELPDDRDTFELVYSLGGTAPGRIPIRTRSLMEVLSQLAADIAVPQGDFVNGRTEPGDPGPGSGLVPQVQVRHGFLQPRDAFVAVLYDGDWFWIENSDIVSKRVFSFVMLLLSLSESSTPGQAPVIAIPAG